MSSSSLQSFTTGSEWFRPVLRPVSSPLLGPSRGPGLGNHWNCRLAQNQSNKDGVVKVTSGKRRGPKAKEHRLENEMLTAPAIAARTGLSLKTVHRRLKMGVPLDKPRGWCAYGNPIRTRHATLYPWDGQAKTAAQWARDFGVTPQCIRERAKLRQPLDGSAARARRSATGTHAALGPGSVFDDSRRPEDDRAVAEVEAYLSRATLTATDEEIRAQFADLGRLSDEGVDWAREQAELILFHHNKLTSSDGESLELIGDLYGFCRERTRQLEERSMRRLKRVLQERGMVPTLIAELRERDTRRKASWAETMEAMAPGSFE